MCSVKHLNKNDQLVILTILQVVLALISKLHVRFCINSELEEGYARGIFGRESRDEGAIALDALWKSGLRLDVFGTLAECVKCRTGADCITAQYVTSECGARIAVACGEPSPSVASCRCGVAVVPQPAAIPKSKSALVTVINAGFCHATT